VSQAKEGKIEEILSLENKNAEIDKRLEKALSIIVETGKGSHNGKLNRKII